jgi:hypothetical protein
MTIALPSPPHKRARLARALDAAALEQWPIVDATQIKDPADRKRFEDLKCAIELYAAGELVRKAISVAQVSERWFYRLVVNCARPAPDGRPWGYRALVARTARTAPVRVKPRVESANPSSGYGGYFRKLLHDKPEIEAGLVSALKRLGKDQLQPNKLGFRGVHRLFIRECKKAGLADGDYPLNTEAKARVPLRRWLNDDFMSKHAVSWLGLEVSPDAAQAAGYGQGNGLDTRIEEPYSAWQIDEMTLDVQAVYRFLTETGGIDDLVLDRCMVIRVIALGSSVNLSWQMVVARQVAAHDLTSLMWDAINGHRPAGRAIPGLDYHEDCGYPSTVFPELRHRVPSVIYLDNALAHLADAFQRLVMFLWGAIVRVGRPGVPQERADVEAQIGVMARQLLHQLPGTTGSHPTSGLRKRAKRMATHRLDVAELEHTIDVYLANRNGMPAAAARYSSPLELLGRQIEAGQIKANTLPVARRRAHLFYSPMPVTIRVDLKRGRRPFVNFLGVRYSSAGLQRSFAMVGKVLTARCDPRDLRTIWLYDPTTGHEVDVLHALGRWGKFPHDMRIRKLFLLLKRKAQFGERADDEPLEQLYAYLRSTAPHDRRDATRLTYLMHYLESWVDPLDPGIAKAAVAWREAQERLGEAETLPLSSPSRDLPDDVEDARVVTSPRGAETSPRVVLTFAPTTRRRVRA